MAHIAEACRPDLALRQWCAMNARNGATRRIAARRARGLRARIIPARNILPGGGAAAQTRWLSGPVGRRVALLGRDDRGGSSGGPVLAAQEHGPPDFRDHVAERPRKWVRCPEV